MTHVITLLTDFGLQDSYVAQMKGVILSVLPQATIVDISHEIGPQNVGQASRILRQATPCFPAKSVHVAVVDPGVGTDRQIVAAKIAKQIYVLPDNGLLSDLLERHSVEWCVRVENRDFWRDEISSTFHGRDIMSPVAAQLCKGLDARELGPACPADTLVRIRRQTRGVRSVDGWLAVEVLDVDHFGNVILDLGVAAHPREGALRIRKQAHAKALLVPIVKTYGNADEGSLVALVGSSGEWELAVVGGSASKLLDISAFDRVYVEN